MALLLPKIISKQVNHPDFSDLCSAHHIEGLLFHFYPQFRANNTYKTAWIQNWHRNDLAIQTLIETFQSIDMTHKPVLLKGAALLGSIYKDIGSRFMSDIDLLIHPEDMKSAEKALESRGFRQIQSSKWKANNFKSEWSLIIEETELCIELHSKLYYHVKNKYEDFHFKKSHIVGFLELDKVDQLIHLSAHYIFQHTFQKIYWAFDLFLFAETYIKESDFSEVMARSKRFKVKNSVNYSLQLLREHFNMDYSTHSKYSVGHDFIWSTDRNTLEYYLIKHRTKDSLLTAIEYDFLNLFSKL